MNSIEQNALYNWQGNYQLPDFAKIKEEDYVNCFDYALLTAEKELETLANSPFDDIDHFFVLYELSGEMLERFCAIFWLYVGANSTENIQKYEIEFATKLSLFSSKWMQDARLFKKIQNLYQASQEKDFDMEIKRAIDKYYRAFVASGALLSQEDKEKLRQIEKDKTNLQTQFAQNVLKEEAEWILFLKEEDLKGLPKAFKESMKALALERGQNEAYALNLSRSMVETFLSFSQNRALRKKVFDAFTGRADQENAYNNNEILTQILALRLKKAKLLGFKNFAEFKIEKMMAKTPKNVFALLNPVWEKAKLKALQEQAALSKIAEQDGLKMPIEGHDWRYYAEKLRSQNYAFDESDIKPYFELNAILEAAFATAEKLFGLSFVEDKSVALWHKDARFFVVYNKEKQVIGYFIGDYFARTSKRSGAWMSALRTQHKLKSNVLPIIYNICNFTKGGDGKPALLSLQDARTLFHEFGHALHGLLSNVTWPSVSGTSVARDFVELPSQLYEHWLMSDFVLKNYARHEKTGQKMPEDLLKKLLKAKDFNAGFDAVEFIASALLDMELHEQEEAVQIDQFEQERRLKWGMPNVIEMRHRAPHFNHIFANDGYAAGYYSYMWSEVLDADAFCAFEDKGDVFDQELAEKLLRYIYSAGDSEDPAILYKKFRGQKPDSSALIKKRGL